MSADDKRDRKTAPILQLFNGGKREAQLTDAELVAVRRMLAEFEMVCNGCPVARQIMDR